MQSKILSIVLSVTILISLFFLLKKEQSRRVVKSDFIEVSKAKYGIFNVDIWKEKISEIIANKIDEFQFDPENKEQLIKKLERFLYDGVDLLETSYKSQQYSSISRFLQNAVASSIDVFDRIRENIPALATDIVNDLEKPETRAKIKQFIEVKIDQYADETFARVDYTTLNRILQKYEAQDYQQAKEYLHGQLNDHTQSAWIFKVIVYICTLGFIALVLGTKENSKVVLMASLVACMGLLLMGLLLPMIDIDARITEFDLVILDEHVHFRNQVLYFKSKSILEVVGLMFSQGRVDIVVVGFLVLTFSVLFPATKIISCFNYLISKSRNHSRLTDFFVFKSGKWSMADVLVVAIFMAYVGFSSILSEQLGQLEKLSDSLQVLTTNRSELNAGFFMFFGFVCLSLVVSDRIKKVTAQ